jgi:hypothetical protein
MPPDEPPDDRGEGSSRSEYDMYVVVLTVYIQAAG